MRKFARWAVTPLCFFSISWGSSGLAQNSDSSIENFKIETGANSSVSLKFPDGREAALALYGSGYHTFVMPMTMTENMCNEIRQVQCRLNLRAELQILNLTWTKHSDSTKVGAQISFRETPAGSVENIFGTLQTELEENGTKDLLICDDYRWLTNNKNNDLNRHQFIHSWGSEANFPNAETGLSENRTVGGGFDLLLTARFGRMYQVSVGKEIVSSETNPGLLANGPVTMVMTDRSNHELCQVQFSADISKVTTKISQVLSRLTSSRSSLPKKSYAKAIKLLKSYQTRTGEFL